ncbi:hypothetical protein ABZW03_28185 [Kitasatospora sp. NPDC004799]|uniref:hypothetical protein n=1 Tax=Kitasatospora sp. NPDC004799 TaxID=3154460 RepID=UPI0033A50608
MRTVPRIAGARRSAATARLDVDLPLQPASATGDAGMNAGVFASVEHWILPLDSGGGDMAVLRLEAPLPGGLLTHQACTANWAASAAR